MTGPGRVLLASLVAAAPAPAPVPRRRPPPTATACSGSAADRPDRLAAAPPARRARVRRSRRSRHSGVSRRSSSRSASQAATDSRDRGRDRSLVVGIGDPGRAGVAQQRRGVALGRHEREDRALGGEVLEDLARDDREPAAAGARHEQQEDVGRPHGGERLGVRPEALERERIAEAEAERPLAIGRPQLAQEGRLHALAQLGALAAARAANAPRNGRGVRWPKNEPAWTMRMRSPRTYASPSNSSKSQPFATTRTGVPAGASSAASSAIVGVTALTAATRRSAARAMRASTARLARTLRFS